MYFNVYCCCCGLRHIAVILISVFLKAFHRNVTEIRQIRLEIYVIQYIYTPYEIPRHLSEHLASKTLLIAIFTFLYIVNRREHLQFRICSSCCRKIHAMWSYIGKHGTEGEKSLKQGHENEKQKNMKCMGVFSIAAVVFYPIFFHYILRNICCVLYTYIYFACRWSAWLADTWASVERSTVTCCCRWPAKRTWWDEPNTGVLSIQLESSRILFWRIRLFAVPFHFCCWCWCRCSVLVRYGM